ncbi:MAG: hypothetical protein ABRQ38_02085 [Candidatus Eremiobacterota bacterium]
MKNFDVGMTMRAKGNEEARKEIDKVQKGIDELRKKAIELNKELKEKQSLKVDTKEVEQKLEDVNKQLGEEKKLLGLLSEEAKRAGNELKTLADRALVENLRDMSNVLGSISGAVINFGKDIVDAASQAENFAVAMNTAFQGNQEAADRMLQWAKEFANATPFETNEIIDATIKLKSYGVAAEDIPDKLRLIGDMASAMNRSLDEAVDAVNKATVGELERLEGFAITKKMLNDEVNGTLLDSKNQITDMNLLMESLSSIMEKRFAGGMERASKTTAGQISNLRGEFQSLKEELGQEVLPAVNSTVEGLTKLVKWTKELPPELKSTALTFTAWAGGIALAGQGVTGFLSAAAPFKAVMDTMGAKIITASGSTAALGSSMSAFAAALPVVAVGAFVIALGALAYAYSEVLKNEAEMKQNDIEEALKRRANALKGVKDAGMDATNAQTAYNEVVKEGVKALSEDAQGLEKVKSTQKLLVEEEAQLQDKRSQDKQELTRLQDELNKALEGAVVQEADANGQIVQKVKLNEDLITSLQGQIKQQQGIVDKDNEHIQVLRDKKKNLVDIRAELEKNNEVENNKYGPGVDGKTSIEDEAFKKKLNFYKDDLEHLRSYWNEYKLTYIQQLELTETITKAKEKQASEEKKINDKKIKEADRANKEQAAKAKKYQEEWEKSQKEKAAAEEEAWKKTIQTQAETLEAEGKTVEAKKLLLKTKEKDLRDSGVAETEIVKWKEAQIQKIEADGLEEAKKKAEEKLKANKEVEEAIAGISESAVERQISSIKKQAEEWEKSGADIIKIEEYKNKAIQKFQEETFQDFKQKEDQKKKEIEDTAKTIQSINDKIAANNQKIKDLESGSSFGAGSPLMSAEEALSKSFSDHLDPYIEKLEQAKALEQENQALMSERDKAFQKEQEQQSELKKIQEERNTAQDAFNTALQGTVDKYSAVSQTSPWEAEKKKIEEATAAAEKYNSVSSGGGEGSGSDADKKSGGGSGEGGGNNGGGNQGNSSGDNSPSTGKQNYIPAYTPQGQGGNNPNSSTQGQGGNLPSNYTKGGFSTNTSSIANPYAGQFGAGSTPQPLQPSVNPSRSNQGWDWTPNYSTLGDLGSWGFDNPVHDKMAFKAMEKMTSDFAIPLVTKSMKDMVTNMLGGMVSSVSSIVNSPSYSTTNSQVSNYKSTTSITNYNTSLDNKQIATSSPVERNVRELNSLLQKFKRV